jgi:FdhD protein
MAVYSVCAADVILPAVTERHGVRYVDLVRVDGGAAHAARDAVAVEAALEIRVDGESFAVTMRTPGADAELAAGFLFTEGLVTSVADIASVEARTGDHLVDVTLVPAAAFRAAERRAARRQVTTTSSCGMCGRPTLASTRLEAPVVDAAWAVPAATIAMLPSRIGPRQATFAETGGIHAAALCAPDGAILDAAEDVGRHNAVDKIIGRRLLAGALPARDALLFVSGRTSFEIVQKAWLAGVPIVAAVSAPSSLAIDLAQEAGITLVGFVRGGRCNVYTHPARVQAGRPVHA